MNFLFLLKPMTMPTYISINITGYQEDHIDWKIKTSNKYVIATPLILEMKLFAKASEVSELGTYDNKNKLFKYPKNISHADLYEDILRITDAYIVSKINHFHEYEKKINH
jgi:hypothetical protein